MRAAVRENDGYRALSTADPVRPPCHGAKHAWIGQRHGEILAAEDGLADAEGDDRLTDIVAKMTAQADFRKLAGGRRAPSTGNGHAERSPHGEEQGLKRECEGNLSGQRSGAPERGEQRDSEQEPWHEGQPDAFDLGFAHQR